MNTITIRSIRVFTSPILALEDAQRRSWKEIYHNRGAHLFAVGDVDDLPAHTEGLWHEVSLAELERFAAAYALPGRPRFAIVQGSRVYAVDLDRAQAEDWRENFYPCADVVEWTPDTEPIMPFDGTDESPDL